MLIRLEFGSSADGFYSSNKNNIPSVVPQVRSGDGRMYTNLTFAGVDKLFPINYRLKEV